MISCSVTIQMKASEQYFPVVLFIVLYKVVLTFESVDGVSIQMTPLWQYINTVLIVSQKDFGQFWGWKGKALSLE